VYTTCLFCYGHLGENIAIEPFPIGLRLAFDAFQGRLWVVCPRCERWNLTPLEERWEAVEECERRFRGERKRVTGENIGLARLDEGLELVRVGKPLRTEFAAWRYGDQFGRRRRRTMLTGLGLAAIGGATIAGGAAVGAISLAGLWAYPRIERMWRAARQRRIIARVPRWVGDPFTVRGEHLDGLRLHPDWDAEGGWKLELPHDAGVTTIDGWDAVNATALLTPRINHDGVPTRSAREAIQRLEAFADPVQYLLAASHVADWKAPGHKTTARLPLVTRLAIEMAANEENERIALEGDLALLELDWKEAEEIAAIADSLALPREVEEQYEAIRKRLSS
jgi:hypothetical protein